MSHEAADRQHGGPMHRSDQRAVRLLGRPGWSRFKVAAAAAVIVAAGGTAGYGAHHASRPRPVALTAAPTTGLPHGEHRPPRLARVVGGPAAEAQGQREEGSADVGVLATAVVPSGRV
jgi:hypothetical protein